MKNRIVNLLLLIGLGVTVIIVVAAVVGSENYKPGTAAIILAIAAVIYSGLNYFVMDESAKNSQIESKKQTELLSRIASELAESRSYRESKLTYKLTRFFRKQKTTELR